MILVYLNLVYKWYKWRVGIIPVNAGIFTTYSGQHELEPEYQQFIFRCFLLELEILYWYPVPVDRNQNSGSSSGRNIWFRSFPS